MFIGTMPPLCTPRDLTFSVSTCHHMLIAACNPFTSPNSRLQVWFYIFTTSIENLEGAEIPDAVAVSSVITSASFNPEMCFTLAELLLQQYAQGGSGTNLLASYLSVYT